MTATTTHAGEAYVEEVDFTPSAQKAVTLEEAKGFGKALNDIEDWIFEMLIGAAQQAFAEYTQSFLFETAVTAKVSVPEAGAGFRVPYCPIVAVQSVTTGGSEASYSQQGNWITASGSGLLTIKYTCSRYEDPADVPAKIKIGLLKWIATNYNDRENTIVEQINEMPNGSKMQWKPYRYMIG